MAKQLTIRGVPDEVVVRLANLSRERGRSTNQTVIEILVRAVGDSERRARFEGYATWSDADSKEFQSTLDAQRVIDDELWS